MKTTSRKTAPILKPRYDFAEFARRGDEIYERDIRPKYELSKAGQFVAIDIETGAYEVDADELKACDRLLDRVPDAQTWLRKIGSRGAHHFGPRKRSATINTARNIY